MKSIILSCMDKKTPKLRRDRIEKLMNDRGWDVGILAYQSGVKSSTIYRYLDGTRKLQASLTNLAFIAGALGCSLEFIIDMTDIATPGVVMRLTPAQQDAIHKIGELSPRSQRQLAAYIRLLSDSDAQEREWIKRNIATNEKLLGFITYVGGEDAFFELLNTLGKPATDQLGLTDEDDDPDNTEDADDADEPLDDEGED